MDYKKIAEEITWLGHDGFLIRAGNRVIVIDPYQVSTTTPADIILITHEHYDHCSPEDIDQFRGDTTVIVTEADSAKKLQGDVRVVKPGETITVHGMEIEAVRAYNIDKKFHPKEKDWLGFIVTIDGCRIYHAGDTDLIDEMEGLQTDIALLPVSGTYVMTAAEAVEAATRIQPKLAIPMHYDALVGSIDDAQLFAAQLAGTCEVTILDKK